MSLRNTDLYKWASTEKGLITWTSILGALAGVLYAWEKPFPSIDWGARFLNGMAVVSILSGTVIRYVVAANRERAGKTTKDIQDTLKTTSEQMVYHFKKLTYDGEIQHYKFMLGNQGPVALPNVWHYRLRFDSYSQLHIEVLDSANAAIKDNYIVRVLGYHEINRGGFVDRFYLVRVTDVLTQGNPAAPIYALDSVLACSWSNQKSVICEATTNDPADGFAIHDFSITGVPGAVTMHAGVPLASQVTVQPRLHDELGLNR